MKRTIVAIALMGSGLLALHGGAPTAKAAQFEDGRVIFDTPPRLVDFLATRTSTTERNATYYFTLDLPEGAGESLKTLEITLFEGRDSLLNFRLEETRFFVGSRPQRGEALPLELVTYDAEQQQIVVSLAEPVAPGQRVTLAMYPVRNPRWEGVYLFDVTAIPDGAGGQRQWIGTARLHIYRPDRDPLFP
jgi:hypothetical protein